MSAALSAGNNESRTVLLPIADRRSTAALVWQLVRHRRVSLALACVCFVLVGLCGLVAPWVLGQVVDAATGAPTTGTADRVVVRAALLIAVAALVGGLALRASTSFLARAGEPALASLREQVLDRALHLDSATVERAGTGDLLSRVSDDVRTVTTALFEVIPLLVNSLVAVGFTTAGLFALDWRLGLAGLAAGPFYVLALRWYLPRSGPFYVRERVAQGERAQALVDGLQGAATLRALGWGSAQVTRVERASWGAARIAIDVFRLLTRYSGRNNASELLGLSFILLVGFWLVRSGEGSVGAVTAAALYFHRLFNPVGALMMIFDDVQSTGASLARLAGVARMPRAERVPTVQTGPTGSTSRGGLELLGVSHAYVDGHPVLREVTVTVAPGERVALVGATGAGKTTLAAIAAGVLEPTAGQVRVAGRGRVRQRVAMVSQDLHVFAGTVRDSLTLARENATDAEVAAALATVRATDWVAALPLGVDTEIGDGRHPITPAQAQQLALARVALTDPDVVVLDEATAEAGSAGARDLEAAALAVTQGRSSLVVAHRLTQAATASRVLVMHDGVVVEEGNHAELVARGGRYADLWAAWSGSR